MFIDPPELNVFHTFDMLPSNALSSVISSVSILRKSTFWSLSQKLSVLYFMQWLSRWSSSSSEPHVTHRLLRLSLKFFPHSSIPNRAIMTVFVSCSERWMRNEAVGFFNDCPPHWIMAEGNGYERTLRLQIFIICHSISVNDDQNSIAPDLTRTLSKTDSRSDIHKPPGKSIWFHV